jgi:hypothetical protein
VGWDAARISFHKDLCSDLRLFFYVAQLFQDLCYVG